MAPLRPLLPLVACLSLASGYSLTLPPAYRRPRAAVRLADEEPKSESKVTVRVRPRDSAASPAAAAPPAEVEVRTSIKVNKPAAPARPPPPPRPSRPPEEELLLDATQSANCSAILEALRRGANPNIVDPKGRTPLHFMAGVGLAPACVLLIHFGARVDVQDEDGLTPLHMAAGYANARTLKVLVAAGADLQLTGEGQGTALEVVQGLGEYEYKKVFGGEVKKEMFKKKDEKLQKLKACVDVLLEPEKVKAENQWEDMLRDTMRVLSL